MTREVEEVAASPSANEVLEVVTVEEGVDDTEVEFDLLLLLASRIAVWALKHTGHRLRLMRSLQVQACAAQ